jgi:hypothetical protein
MIRILRPKATSFVLDEEELCEVPTCPGSQTHTVTGKVVSMLVCRAHADRLKVKAPNAKVKAL